MKIVHICLNGPYTENWGYQENLITKYQARQGHDVTIIATNTQHVNSGEIVETDCVDYINHNGVRVIRIKKQKSIIPRYVDFFVPYNIYPILCKLHPSIIMVHGFIGSISALQVEKYIKRIDSNCQVVVDIHEDFDNSPIKKSALRYLLMIVHRILNGKMFPLYKKIFYVAPSAREYAKKYYHVPIDKLELLPMGCDNEYIDFAHKNIIRTEVRAQYGIDDGDIVLCHGGKLNSLKKTKELVEAFNKLSTEYSNLKLLLFGAFYEDYESQVFPHGKPNGVIFTGMLTIEAYYRVYLASDLAVFPGGQSALWQQAIACGIATVFPDFPHTQYLNLGGNAAFFEDMTSEKIYETLKKIISQKQYIQMGKIARELGIEFFSYERIAQRVIDAAMGKV